MNPFLNLLFLIMAIPAAAQPHVRNVGQEARALKNILLQHHVDPKVVDDHFSRLLFDKLFDDFDPERLIFTETDIAWLKPFEESLDDEINLARTAFINRFSERYRSGLERSERITKEILDTPLNWKERESFRSPEGWTKNEADLIAHHRRLLKFQVLERLEEKLERDSLAMNDFFVKHIDAALAHVKNRTLPTTSPRL